MRCLWVVLMLAGCAGAPPASPDDATFETVFFELEGSGRIAYRLVIEGAPGTACWWQQASAFEENSHDEPAGFRAVFRNGTLAFASWNLATRGDRILVNEHDLSFTDYVSAIAHASGAELNGTGRMEVWFSYGALQWIHTSSLACDGRPASVRWYSLDGVLWDMNTLEGGPFMNQPVGGFLAPVQVTVARDYGTELSVQGELVGTLFSRDAPGALDVVGPSPKRIPLGPGVTFDLWTGEPGDYALRWEATHAGPRYSLTGALLDAVETDPANIPGYS